MLPDPGRRRRADRRRLLNPPPSLNYTDAKRVVDPIGEEFFNILLGLLPNSFRESSAAFALLKQIRAAIYAAEWNGTAKATDLLVLCALDEIIKASLKTKFGASVR